MIFIINFLFLNNYGFTGRYVKRVQRSPMYPHPVSPNGDSLHKYNTTLNLGIDIGTAQTLLRSYMFQIFILYQFYTCVYV